MIRELKSKEELTAAFPVMAELRPHLTLESFLTLFAEMSAREGYRLFAATEEGQIAALMGARFYTDLVRGRHLYIDDLVTSQKLRSQGHGKLLLAYAERLAQEEKCESLRLCVVVENEGGIRFYEREQWKRRAYAFQKRIN